MVVEIVIQMCVKQVVLVTLLFNVHVILNMEYNTKDIKYPYNLNMKKYSNNDKKIWYELFALNIKKGNSEDHGHYFCYIKINDIWYLFDDNRVIRQKPENTLGKIVGFFYQIKN